MFPAGIFFLFMAVLDPRLQETHWQVLEGNFNYYQCSNMEIYFKDNPVRKMDDGSTHIITVAKCLKEING